jgi:GAF domain-containing protein
VFPTVNQAFQLLQTLGQSPGRQAALLRKIVDRIRNSLELQVVLQTAVDEVAALLKLDSCIFLWYLKDTQQIRVVCERTHGSHSYSLLGYYPLERFGAVASAVAMGKLMMENGKTAPQERLLRVVMRKPPWLKELLRQSWGNQSPHDFPENPLKRIDKF